MGGYVECATVGASKGGAAELAKRLGDPHLHR
jgi:hypothetical protein